MKDLILTAITKNPGITLSELEQRAEKRGVPLLELYAVLETIHRDKQVTQTTKGDDVVYRPTSTVPRRTTSTSHLTWVRQHYPWPDKFEMPFPEIDMSWMFLRTVEERDAYKAAAKGQPLYMLKSKGGKNPGRRYST